MVFSLTDTKKLKGTKHYFDGKITNAFVDENGNITLNLDSPNAAHSTVGHEITHVLEGTEFYKTLRETVFNYAISKEGLENFNKRLKETEERYKDINKDPEAEVLADLIGDYLFTDEDFVNNLAKTDRNAFQKIWDEIKYLCKVVTAGSKEARELEKVKRAFEKAYRADSKTTSKANVAQYSLIGKNKYGIEVYETSQSVMDLTWEDRKAKYLDVMKNEYRGRTAKFERNGHVYYAKFDQSSVRKPIYGDSRSSTAGVKSLIKAGADGDVFDLVENSQYTGSKQNTKTHTKADYFDYFVKTVQIDGKVFDLVADVEKKYGVEDGYVYTLALVDNKKSKASPALGTPSKVPVKSAGNALTNNVTQEAPIVNEQFSLSDSEVAPISEGYKYSIGEIIDENNKSYGVGVHLDSTLLDNLSTEERLGMVKEYVKELGGESFTAYDNSGNAVEVTIAKSNARYKNHSGKKTPVNKNLTTKYIGNEVKQESIALIDELIVTAEYDGSKAPKYAHGWLDNNGQNDWDYWTTFIQDKNNTIWEATLNIANTADGEKILYDISPIKKVGQSVKSDTIPTDNNIAQDGSVVNSNNSLSNIGEEQKAYGNLNTPLDKFRYEEAPLQEDIAPVKPSANSKVEAAEDLFTDDIAPVAEKRTDMQDIAPTAKEGKVKTVNERLLAKVKNLEKELTNKLHTGLKLVFKNCVMRKKL